MKFGLKVHHTDVDRLLYLRPDALEFALFHGDLGGEWVDRIDFTGPVIVHAPEKHADGTILDAGAEDEVQRARAVEVLERTIDLSVRLKAETLICHPGGVFRENRAVSPESLIRTMAGLKAYAGDRVELLLENMPGYYRTRGELWHPCLLARAEEIMAVLDRTGTGLCLDVCHAKLYCTVYGVNFHQYLEALLPYARHLHVSDALGEAGEGLQIGEGEIDWGWLTSATKAFDLVAVPEIDDGFRDDGKGFRLALDRLASMGFYSRS
ncbi:sugar phosphate isomerase/epimerase family protein [Methanocella sp. MCL-LM]|uniref:sugar phosphate isomerase/epimerase family protein n=1 Tax=Methanocella sp. MCL-LM TaxID=3412035 RepID=UPI003C78C892